MSDQIELCLVSLPSILCRLLFIYQIYCHQLCAFWSSLIEFKASSSSTTKFITHDGNNTNNNNNNFISLHDLRILSEANKLNALTNDTMWAMVYL